jgi:2-isopropylmalate synthase
MDHRQKVRAEAACRGEASTVGRWTLSRLEILSTVEPRKWPVARVELLHSTRGRLFEIGTGCGGVDAAFNAVAQIFGMSAPVEQLDLRYRVDTIAGRSLPEVTVKICVSIDGENFQGSAETADILTSCVAAYVDALSRAELTGTRGYVARSPCAPGALQS